MPLRSPSGAIQIPRASEGNVVEDDLDGKVVWAEGAKVSPASRRTTGQPGTRAQGLPADPWENYLSVGSNLREP